MAALLGYLDLRYREKYQDGHGTLVEWQAESADRFPAYKGLKPAL